jgi:hypothetical protein
MLVCAECGKPKSPSGSPFCPSCASTWESKAFTVRQEFDSSGLPKTNVLASSLSLQLSGAGKDGWEPCDVVGDTGEITVILKRSRETPPSKMDYVVISFQMRNDAPRAYRNGVEIHELPGSGVSYNGYFQWYKSRGWLYHNFQVPTPNPSYNDLMCIFARRV